VRAGKQALMKRLLLLIVVAAALMAAAPALGAPSSFDTLAREYVQDWLARNPTTATYDGEHRYDADLEDYSRAGVARDIAAERAWLARFAAVDRRRLTRLQRGDLDLVLDNIHSTLLELERIRSWEKNPDHYSSGVSASIFAIMARRFASPEERLERVIAREKKIPAVLDDARVNLRNPPKVYTEIAIEQLPGIVGFFQKDVPLAFKDVKDEALLARFHAANDAVIEALKAYQSWLQTDLLPRSHGDYRIGAENFRLKLRYDEMVDIPLKRLLSIGYADLRHNQRRFREAAARYKPGASPKAVLAEIATDHPKPDALLGSFRDVLGGLRAYIVAHHIVDIPSTVMPILEETPPFERATTMASMDTPGPLERVAKEAYFNVTLPEKSWTPREVAEHMAGFTRGTIISTAVHEAYPGHYVQFLWIQSAPSLVRKIFGCNTNVEGWAHYCEQMMLDQGYGNGDVRLRLGQLQDALLRDARYVVAIQMHTGKMTYDQAVDFFVNEGYQSRTNAIREVKRGTADPTYLYYTLGKLEIMKLRDDYRRKMGARFSLREFHDRLLQQGAPPLAIIRKAMLGDGSPAL
jgi:uncharacterized protein (DUF885 family)